MNLRRCREADAHLVDADGITIAGNRQAADELRLRAGREHGKCNEHHHAHHPNGKFLAKHQFVTLVGSIRRVCASWLATDRHTRAEMLVIIARKAKQRRRVENKHIKSPDDSGAAQRSRSRAACEPAPCEWCEVWARGPAAIRKRTKDRQRHPAKAGRRHAAVPKVFLD